MVEFEVASALDLKLKGGHLVAVRYFSFYACVKDSSGNPFCFSDISFLEKCCGKKIVTDSLTRRETPK